MPGGKVVDDGCVDFLDHFAFHHHVDLKVNVSGPEILGLANLLDSPVERE